MHELTLFTNPTFGAIRTLENDDGKVLFCGKDVAAALGYSNQRDALAKHCKGVVKRDTLTNGGKQELSFIPESDVYRLAFGSKLPTAEQFTDWVTSEVLHTIRRHGAYLTPDVLSQTIQNPDFLIGLVTELKAEQERRRTLERQTEADKPTVVFADAVSASKSAILIGDLAKLLKQNGVDTGQKRLFEWMRRNGYLIRSRCQSYNLPTQRSMEMGLFEIKETAVNHSDGHITVNKTVKVTGKGQQYFINKFLGGTV